MYVLVESPVYKVKLRDADEQINCEKSNTMAYWEHTKNHQQT